MIQHVPMMRSVAANVPVAWPHDGNETRAGPGGAGQTIAAQYKNPMPGMPGLLMLPDHATWPEGGFSTEAAVDELAQLLEGQPMLTDPGLVIAPAGHHVRGRVQILAGDRARLSHQASAVRVRA